MTAPITVAPDEVDEVVTTLRAAIDVLKLRGWAQHTWGVTGVGPLCIEGAIAAAIGLKGDEMPLIGYWCPTYGAVAQYLSVGSLADWNDRQWREPEEAMAALTGTLAAIEQAREDAPTGQLFVAAGEEA